MEEEQFEFEQNCEGEALSEIESACAEETPMPTIETLTTEVEEKFVEEGANLEHDRWSRWQNWMFQCSIKNDDGTITIPKDKVERWFRQIDTPYSKLSEEEKESDRKETRNYLPLILPYLSQAEQIGYERGRTELAEEVKQLKEDLMLATNIINQIK